MPTHKTLTDAAVRKLKAKKSQQIDHFDQQYPGLAIRVSHSRKVWVYFHRLKGDPKLRRLTFTAAREREAPQEIGAIA